MIANNDLMVGGTNWIGHGSNKVVKRGGGT